MALKILVGFLAAILVTGAGVYFAMPDHTCRGSKCSTVGELPTSEGSSCCGLAETATCPDSIAACTGGTSVAVAQSNAAACSKKSIGCCDE